MSIFHLALLANITSPCIHGVYITISIYPTANRLPHILGLLSEFDSSSEPCKICRSDQRRIRLCYWKCCNAEKDASTKTSITTNRLKGSHRAVRI
ncbi:MAG: hypothetical protein [Circular genetic element sp.]|nr:MAG: hypothetical protein [Circular genetic element sp.]